MKGICGANCEECELFKNNSCKGCHVGKKCWVADYIKIGGEKNFNSLKKELINEINNLKIDGMKKINELYELKGLFVNLEYTLPSGKKVKYLDDNEVYLGNQIECDYSDNDIKKCFGIVCNMSFILISEYEENGTNPELIIYKRR